MRIVRPGRPGSIAALLRAVEGAEPTYEAQGATLGGALPAGFRHLSDATVLGHGPRDFARASEGLRTWQAHRLPGVRVFPHGAPLRAGTSVVVTLGTDLAAVAAPCRSSRSSRSLGGSASLTAPCPATPSGGRRRSSSP